MRQLKVWGRTVLVIGILTAFLLPAAADSGSYNSYLKDEKGEPVAAPYSYAVEEVLDGVSMGIGALSSPQDFHIVGDAYLYLLDAGNQRIVKLDREYRPVLILDRFTGPDGQPYTFQGMNGIHALEDGTLFVADAAGGVVVRMNERGEIAAVYGRPESDMIAENVVYKPDKVMVDGNGILYILATGMYQGALMLDMEGNFLGFYGASPVEVTPTLLFDYYWKKLFSKSQAESLANYVPTEFRNFCLDKDGFIYTVTSVSEQDNNLIRKFNPKGIDILEPEDPVYGDKRTVLYLRDKIKTSFVDVAVHKKGYVLALDQTRGRVFEYDEDMNLLGTFGAKGNQAGTFQAPVAVGYFGEHVLVLDANKANLTIFAPTDYGRRMHIAINLYMDGRYQEALEPWRNVLDQNANAQIAYKGLGRALYGLKDYKSAMENFILAEDTKGYAKAFKEYRSIKLKEWFIPLFAAVVVLAAVGAAATVLSRRRLRMHPELERSGGITTGNAPFYILKRPFGGYADLRQQKCGRWWIAVLILVLWWVAEILARQYGGFTFGRLRPSDINVLYLLAGSAGVLILWSISNWAVSTLSDGSGKLIDIFIFSAYAMVPYVLTRYINFILSHLLVQEEGLIRTYITLFGVLFSGVLMIIAVMTVQEYSFGKAVASCLITLVGITVVLFIILLLFNLLQQFADLVQDIIKELRLRV